jgi:hypothetical protein
MMRVALLAFNRRGVTRAIAAAAMFALVAHAQEATPPVSSARSVRISFLPPPLEGTISLGVYDSNGTLVRILHRESKIEDFHAGADALSTKWDGKDEASNDLPAGNYSARGYVVAEMKLEHVEPAADLASAAASKIAVKLVANPLIKGKRTVDVTAGFDEDASFVQTADGLPLFTVDESPYVFATWLTQRPDKSLDFFQNDGDTVDQFHITGVEKMMAFDCGDFELK